MKNFFHICPPLPICSFFIGLLQWHLDCPPFLGLCICSHFCHVCLIVFPYVFKVGEQEPVVMVDGIICYITLTYHFSDSRPYGFMISLIFFNFVRFYSYKL